MYFYQFLNRERRMKKKLDVPFFRVKRFSLSEWLSNFFFLVSFNAVPRYTFPITLCNVFTNNWKKEGIKTCVEILIYIGFRTLYCLCLQTNKMTSNFMTLLLILLWPWRDIVLVTLLMLMSLSLTLVWPCYFIMTLTLFHIIGVGSMNDQSYLSRWFTHQGVFKILPCIWPLSLTVQMTYIFDLVDDFDLQQDLNPWPWRWPISLIYLLDLYPWPCRQTTGRLLPLLLIHKRSVYIMKRSWRSSDM